MTAWSAASKAATESTAWSTANKLSAQNHSVVSSLLQSQIY